MERYGCAACHAIPGILNQGSNVGPSLYLIASRAYIGGVLLNTPTDMIPRLRDPPAADPRIAMPNVGVAEVLKRRPAWPTISLRRAQG